MNYIELTNEVLLDLNEPLISVALGQSSARGIQKTALKAVRKAYKDMVNDDVKWPFNYQDGSITTVIGQYLYTRETDTKIIDWDSFFINEDLVTDPDLPIYPTHILRLDLATARRYWQTILMQTDTSTYSVPRNVYEDKSGKLAIAPAPDKIYTISYQYYTVPAELALDTDTPIIPEHFHEAIVEGAKMYVFYMRSDYEAGDRSKARFSKDQARMEMELLGNREHFTSKRRLPGGK